VADEEKQEQTQETKDESQEESKETKESTKESTDDTGTEETQKEDSSPSEEEASGEKEPEAEIDWKARAEKAEKGIESMEERINRLTYEVKSTKEQASKPKEKTWDDLSVDELKKYRAHYRKEGNDDGVDFVNDKIAEKLADEKATSKMALRDASKLRVDSWADVVSIYPDLKNKNSEHYKKTLEIVRKNPKLDNIELNPEGHAVAARLAGEEMLREKVRGATKKAQATKAKLTKEQAKLGLESGTKKAVATDTIDKLRKAAENSKGPYSREWRAYFSALDKRDKAKRKE